MQALRATVGRGDCRGEDDTISSFVFSLITQGWMSRSCPNVQGCFKTPGHGINREKLPWVASGLERADGH